MTSQYTSQTQLMPAADAELTTDAVAGAQRGRPQPFQPFQRFRAIGVRSHADAGYLERVEAELVLLREENALSKPRPAGAAAPKPGTSSVTTHRFDASNGAAERQIERVVASPWISTSGSPRPATSTIDVSAPRRRAARAARGPRARRSARSRRRR